MYSYIDRFNGPVYYAKAWDVFLIVSPESEADSGDYVAAKRLEAGTILVQRYQGQPHFGVVFSLNDYFTIDREFLAY